MILSHYEWLNKNYEQFCKTSGYEYHAGVISAHGDKLSRLEHRCEEFDVPFYKVAAIALANWYNRPPRSSGIFAFEDKCIELYLEYQEWYTECGGEEDAVFNI